MIQQIIKIIWAQRKANAWIWAELLLISICLWYITDNLYVKGKTFYQPLGFNISDTYLIELQLLTEGSEGYHAQEEYGTSIGEDLLTVIDRIRTHPDVEYVSISETARPYNPGNNYSGMDRINTETQDTFRIARVHRRFVSPDYFHVFRITSPYTNINTLAENLTFNQDIISKEVEKGLYPEGNAIGKVLRGARDSVHIYTGGVSNSIRHNEFEKEFPVNFRLLSNNQIVKNTDASYFTWLEICIRIKPEAAADFIPRFKKDMKNVIKYHNIYLLDVTSFDKLREQYIRNDVNNMKMYLFVVFFLLINILLGITGTFWFRTQQRQTEMGLRVAMGSTVRELRSLLIGEGLILLLSAFIPALLISVNIMMFELVDTELMSIGIGRFLVCQLATFLLMAAMITLGIWFPSRKVVHLQPAEALHYE